MAIGMPVYAYSSAFIRVPDKAGLSVVMLHRFKDFLAFDAESDQSCDAYNQNAHCHCSTDQNQNTNDTKFKASPPLFTEIWIGGPSLLALFEIALVEVMPLEV